MPPAQSVRILGSTGVIGSSAWWWISNHHINKPIQPPQVEITTLSVQDNIDVPFTSASVDQTIRRGGW